MKKTRIRSPLESLPLHVKQELLGWLTTGGRHGHGMTYAEARTKLAEVHGLKFGTNAIHNFFHRHTRGHGQAHTINAELAPGSDTISVTLNIRIHQQNT